MLIFFFFFLQTPGCHGNTPLSTSISPHPWLFVHVSRTKGKKKEEAEKKIRNHNKLKSPQALCSLRLSGRISAERQSFEDYLKTSTHAHTHAHMHTVNIQYVLYVCFCVEVLPHKHFLKSHYTPRSQTLKGSNPHSQDSWYGNGSVKLQIFLLTTHYCLLSPINVTTSTLWQQETSLLTQIAAGMRRNMWIGWWAQWQSSCLPSLSTVIFHSPPSTPLVYLASVYLRGYYCAASLYWNTENMSGNLVWDALLIIFYQGDKTTGQAERTHGVPFCCSDISHPIKSKRQYGINIKVKKKKHGCKCR